MYEILTTQWGMGHNLAVTLIDHYGCDVYNIFGPLEHLNGHGEDFVTISQGHGDTLSRNEYSKRRGDDFVTASQAQRHILSLCEYFKRQGEDFVTISHAQTDGFQMYLDLDGDKSGDKKRMRELLTQFAEKRYDSISKRPDADPRSWTH